MYPVSAAYKTAIGQNVRDIKITGTITLKDDTIINITDEDIVQGSLYITEQCVAGEDIEVGNVYASEMGLSLSTPLENPYSLDGARILLHFGIDVGGLWETVPLGYFYVTDIARKARNVNLTALDGILLFDIPVGDPGSSSPRNFVVHACEQAGVTLGTSVFEIDTFANAGVLLAAPDASKIKTCRDLLMWACQIMGAFARMNRSGELEIVPIKARPSVKTINKAERFNSDVSDFAIQITKVSMQVGEAEYSRGTDGMTMVLEENPLLAGLSETQINQMLDYLLAQITTAVYVPFNSNFIGDPALQPGDFVTLSDTSVLGGGDVASIITHSTWRYRGPHNIKGAGKHGLVRGVQNQQMKAVSSIVAIARAAQDLALAANQSTQLIKDAIGGHVLIRQNPDETNEILIMDNPDPDQAVKIWRWNMGGLGYSDNCVGADNPDREYEIAMTMDGAINANFIKTGQLDAGVVRIGPETTFAPGYDPSQIEGASAVGMGVDADCLGLWHFDGSLNSHKGVPVESNADYNTGLFGQALNIATGKHLKVPAVGILASQGTINLRAKNLANSPSDSILIEAPQSDNSQGIRAGIASDGRLYAQDLPSLFKYVETTQADFNSGTLTDVVATSAGDLQLATGKKLGIREKVIDLSEIGANNYGSIINFTKTDAVVTNATFTRASVAYLEDGTQVASGVPRFEDGKFDKAVLVEEGTTNRLSASLDFVTGWESYSGASTIVTPGQADPFGGTKAHRIQITGGTSTPKYLTWVDRPSVDGLPYALQVWVRVPSGAPPVNVSANIGTPVTVTSADGWKKVQISVTGDGSSYIGLLFIAQNVSDNLDFYACFPQIENKAYHTSWTSGTRSPETLTIPTAGVIDTQKGTIAMWVKMGIAGDHKTPGANDNIISLNAGVWGVYNNTNIPANNLDFTIGDSWGASVTARCNIVWDKGDWLYIVPKWDLPDISLTVYNFTKGTTATATATGATYTATPTLAHVNCGDGGQFLGYTNSIIDDFRISNRARTDEEIADAYASEEPLPVDEWTTYKMDFDNNLQATVGTVNVEAALSVDGGDNYGQYSEVKSGLSIPGLACDTDLTNGRLKIKETLYTSDVTVTPKLHDLSFSITKKLPTTVYGPNKSTLTAWDSISLAWKPERLSLVVNDEEACYIENPGLPASLGSHVFIGTDRNGANAINTLVDELRIDKVYREPNIRTAWHKMGVPFYTSEDMKQWPGYLRAETDGWKVYDSSNALRVLIGSWLKDAVRKYGAKIIEGEIYSSLIRSGAEDADTYIQFKPPNNLEVYYGGYLQMIIEAVSGGRITFYNNGTMIGRLSGAYSGADLGLLGIDKRKIQVVGDLDVSGSIYKSGGLNYVEPTKDYGIRLLNALEGPELKYVDMGRAQLENGEATVYLDPILLQCIEPDTDLTPWLFKTEVYGEGEDIRVIEWGENYFKVKECNGGTSNRKFGWWFYATRINYAGIRLQEYVAGVV